MQETNTLIFEMAQKNGTLEATLNILKIEMQAEIKYTDNKELALSLQEKVDYIIEQLDKVNND